MTTTKALKREVSNLRRRLEKTESDLVELAKRANAQSVQEVSREIREHHEHYDALRGKVRFGGDDSPKRAMPHHLFPNTVVGSREWHDFGPCHNIHCRDCATAGADECCYCAGPIKVGAPTRRLPVCRRERTDPKTEKFYRKQSSAASVDDLRNLTEAELRVLCAILKSHGAIRDGQYFDAMSTLTMMAHRIAGFKG